MRRCFACSDDSNRVLSLGVPHDDKPLLYGKTSSQETFLTYRMVGVCDGRSQRITKDGARLFKRHFMVCEIFSGLCGIPRKPHEPSVPCAELTAKVSG